MTPTLISVINESARISDADVETMTIAVGAQLGRDVAPVWGLVPAIEFVPKGAQPTPGGCPCYIIDVPDVPNALGYHYEDGQGVPTIKVFVNPTLDNGGTVMTGPNAVSVTLSHEVIELTGDSSANKWADGPSGSDFAIELADAVQGDSYEIGLVSVSNFVWPAFFDRGLPRPGDKLDQLGKLTVPFTMTSGGYQIVRAEPGAISQIFGAKPWYALDGRTCIAFDEAVSTERRTAIVAKYRHTKRRQRKGSTP